MPSVEESKRISTVTIPTCGRPVELSRALSSYIENATRHNRRLRYLIGDDSFSPGNQQNTVGALKRIKQRYGAKISLEYLGPVEREGLARQICRLAGTALEECRTALVSSSPGEFCAGACRNALQLVTVDEVVLSADDDTVCLGTSIDSRHTPRLTAALDPTSIRRLNHLESAPSEVQSDEGDSYLSHEKVLRRSVAGLMPVEDRAGNSRQLIASDSRVRASVSSMIGDCAISSAWDFFVVGGRASERGQELDWPTMKTRQIRRGVDGITITRTAFVPGWNVAFDNFDFLPPFLPFSRGEDVVFGSLLKACQSDSLIAFLPTAIRHLPPPGRTTSRAEIRLASTQVPLYEICDWVISAVGHNRVRQNRQEPAGKVLERLTHVAQLSASDFECFFLSLRKSILQRRLELIKQWMDEKPAIWIGSLLLQCAEAIRQAINTCPAGGADVALIPRTHGGLRQLATVTAAWPSLRRAAQELKRTGVQMARTIEA